MGRLKTILIGAAALCCPILIGTSSAAGEVLRNAAYVSAGCWNQNAPDPGAPDTAPAGIDEISGGSYAEIFENPPSVIDIIPGDLADLIDDGANAAEDSLGTIIDRNRVIIADDEEYSKYTRRNNKILRYNYDRYIDDGSFYLTMGAQVQNCTDIPNDVLRQASGELPEKKKGGEKTPQVLIYHTHATESFMPESDWYDYRYPVSSPDNSRNMIGVGDVLCEELSKRGVSVMHDCTMHDYPLYVDSYFRSEETLKEILAEYPDIQILIDLHRDGIENPDGSIIAPICEINGKNAAQFMIISCCPDDYIMPDYLENFKLACLIQNCSEKLYPKLARPIKFDFRNYNQYLSTGCLLIEIGSHGNSLDEAKYTAELLADIIAEALKIIDR